jgi:hypothetical protein
MKSTLLDRRRRNRALLLLGVSATVIGLAMPARAQVDTVSYGDGDVNTTPIVMTRQTVGNVAPDEAATQSGAISGAYKFSKAASTSIWARSFSPIATRRAPAPSRCSTEHGCVLTSTISA